MWHTLPEAIKLTGRSRRSLYRDMDAGRVSYRVRDDGRRELETSELIRAYGAFAHDADSISRAGTLGTPDTAQSGTPLGTVTPEALQPLLDELQLLRNEVRSLRETMLRIEHKPERKEPYKATPTTSSSAGKVKSFADLVEKFKNERN